MIERSSSVATALDWRTARIIWFEPMGPKRESPRFGSGTSRRVEACSIATARMTRPSTSGFWPRRRCPQFRRTASGDDCEQWILIGSRKSLLSVWELDSGKERLHRDLDGEFLYTIVFSPDGRRVAGTIGHLSKESRASGLFESGMSRRARWS